MYLKTPFTLCDFQIKYDLDVSKRFFFYLKKKKNAINKYHWITLINILVRIQYCSQNVSEN